MSRRSPDSESADRDAWEHAELALLRDRLDALEREGDERELLLEQAEARAAELERRLAVSEVELRDARERADHMAQALAAARKHAADAEQAAEAQHARIVALPPPPEPTDLFDPPPEPTDQFDPPPLQDAAGRRDARAHAKAGARLYEIRDFEGAARAYRAAAALSPRDPTPHLGVARCQRNLGRFDEALGAAQAALAIRPGWRDAAWVALHALARLERASDFAALVAEVIPPRAASTTDLARLAPLALRAGSHGLASEIGERLVGQDPTSRIGRFTVAAARWELGDDAAPQELIEAARASREREVVCAALDLCRRIDDFDDVPELIDLLDPPGGETLMDFADAMLKRGEPRPAIALLDRMPHADDARAKATRARAECLLRVHDGKWAPRLPARRGDAVMGRPLHLVSHSLPHHTSGGTYRTHYVAKAQRAAGLDPHLVTPLGFPHGATPSAEPDVVDGLPYYRLADPLPTDDAQDAWLARNLEALVPLVERLRPSVLHPASDYLNALLALQLRELFGIPVVYEVRGFPEERLVRRPGSRALNDQSVGRRAMELRCMEAADRIVTLAETMKRHMTRRGIAEEKIRIVPNGVDPEVLQPVPRDLLLAARLGIGDGDTVLGYVSTFHGYEGIQYIVRATAELIRRGKRARALLVGDGRERPYLERLARELGVEDAVIFTGRVPHAEVLSYYALIDLFVVPRRAEATSELVTPLKPFEALAVKRAVIVSDVGALREIIRDGETGRVFPPEDHVALADVAEQLIDDPASREALATAGYEWVIRERTWTSNGARYRALYEELGAAAPS